MYGFRMNPDKEYVEKIINGLMKKNGHCPCKIGELDKNLCPCVEFVETKQCHCKLFVPIDEKIK